MYLVTEISKSWGNLFLTQEHARMNDARNTRARGDGCPSSQHCCDDVPKLGIAD
jgi:hypothetical protein